MSWCDKHTNRITECQALAAWSCGMIFTHQWLLFTKISTGDKIINIFALFTSPRRTG